MVQRSAFSLAKMGAKPVTGSDAVLQGDRWRISILTDSLIRFEWSESGRFVDTPTQMALVRDFGCTPKFEAVERGGWLEIDTEHLHISYDRQAFSKEGLYATVKGANAVGNTWHYSDEQHGNLGGTYRTLDGIDGAVPLENGVISRDGWAVLDDSRANIIVESDEVDGEKNPFGTWVLPKTEETTDLYLFGYGHRYREAVHDFYTLTGATPLLPRYVFGNWWSRYHRYTEEEYRELVERFEKEQLPFTTAVIDMDWHVVDDVDPKYGSGWTGYTWNREFFPDPQRFLGWLHEHGMKATLNVHPRDGVRAFEDAYADMAEAMGIDPGSEETVQFDLTSPRFMSAYFDQLHHPMEDEGVDFWWLDWQQGGVTRQKGLDPLWGLNHLHYLDSGRSDGSSYSERNPRPLTFSRYAGPGSHRYPVGFSGDTIVTWESLKFQPYFTATASNIGYGWWSHDIGGHMFGYRDEELEARWYQLGAFSPINRLHSTDSPFNGKEPWNFRGEVESAMVKALRLRHSMIPYLYAMNRRAAVEGDPLVQPMYWDHPEQEDAYTVPTEFMFGTQLLVSPIVSPAERDVQMAKADVWLPEGTWFDFFTGRRYSSPQKEGRRIEVWRGMDGIPAFAKAGGIIPLQRQARDEALNAVSNPQSLEILVFPGADGRFTLWEDTGASEADNTWASTLMTWTYAAERDSVFAIDPVAGDASAVPASRDWTVTFRGVPEFVSERVNVTVDGMPVRPAQIRYDKTTLSLSVDLCGVAASSRVELTVCGGLPLSDNPIVEDAFAVLKDAQVHYRTKEKAYAAIRRFGAASIAGFGAMEVHDDDIQGRFAQSHMPHCVMQALAEVLLRA
ncbi:TIM-barrel domain-containing protein [Bifidobacterium oedipodis]|uniref:Alpha-glucosidase n=1 Tax=Bifidobacterium oedipodis TaxID=2675322 RepID=A0A7Y0EPH6_9BIFI|nr:TIM-barrel domain-containing protein [Bifidobacterium sp. DSM 109957]NMM94041.1 alpha-glucosidase [Bifidobacterium sp. DSM 109957]